MGVPKGSRELWSLRAERSSLQQLSPKISRSPCISSLTPLSTGRATLAPAMHWLLELPSGIKFRLTTLISYLIMDTLLVPFLSLSYFPSGVSWYHLLSELFVLKFLSQGLVLEILVPGELRLLLCCERIWRWSDSKKWVHLERSTSQNVGHL